MSVRPLPHPQQLLLRLHSSLLTPRAQQRGAPAEPAGEDAAAAKGQPPVEPPRGRDYYAGLLSTDIRTTNDATSSDMLLRSLQLAGEPLSGQLVVNAGGMPGGIPRRSTAKPPTDAPPVMPWLAYHLECVASATTLHLLPCFVAGGIAVLLALLTFGFLASNGLV